MAGLQVRRASPGVDVECEPGQRQSMVTSRRGDDASQSSAPGGGLSRQRRPSRGRPGGRCALACRRWASTGPGRAAGSTGDRRCDHAGSGSRPMRCSGSSRPPTRGWQSEAARARQGAARQPSRATTRRRTAPARSASPTAPRARSTAYQLDQARQRAHRRGAPRRLRQGSLDPLAALPAHARAWLDQAPEGAELAIPVFDGRKRYDATLALSRPDPAYRRRRHHTCAPGRDALQAGGGAERGQRRARARAGGRLRELELAVSADGRYVPLRLDGSLDGLPVTAVIEGDCAGPLAAPTRSGACRGWSGQTAASPSVSVAGVV